jgi:hypothetical protein
MEKITKCWGTLVDEFAPPEAVKKGMEKLIEEILRDKDISSYLNERMYCLLSGKGINDMDIEVKLGECHLKKQIEQEKWLFKNNNYISELDKEMDLLLKIQSLIINLKHLYGKTD